MIKRIKAWKLRTKLLILILAAGGLSILLFQLLWSSQGMVWTFFSHFPSFYWDQEAFVQELREEAIHYDIPSSDQDTDAIQKLKPFMELRDFYTGVYIYGDDDGLYRTGKWAEIMDTLVSGSIIHAGYTIAGRDGEHTIETEMDFRNGTAIVVILSLHPARIVYPHFFLSLFLSVFTFLFIILKFISQKMKAVLSLKDEILLMASGQLDHPIPSYGEDEIGILSTQLDQLRTTLSENIRLESESRLANHDLVTAMSHDLRTPLTILNGYLEILKLNRNPSSREEYVDRCLQKAGDLKEMTDKMFEYAQVYEETEDIALREIPLAFLLQCLDENIDFIKLAGFTAETIFSSDPACMIAGDETMLKRIFNNLFSNILKYGDKKSNVQVSLRAEQERLQILLQNKINPDKAEIESNRIGLKSTEKMVLLHQGGLCHEEKDCTFTVNLWFPLLFPI